MTRLLRPVADRERGNGRGRLRRPYAWLVAGSRMMIDDGLIRGHYADLATEDSSWSLSATALWRVKMSSLRPAWCGCPWPLGAVREGRICCSPMPVLFPCRHVHHIPSGDDFFRHFGGDNALPCGHKQTPDRWCECASCCALQRQS